MNIPSERANAVSGIRRSLFGAVAAILALCAPAPYALAEGAAAAAPAVNASCSPVAPAPAGIVKPTGADAGTYTYNSCSGLWENQYYIWSPASKTAMPKTPYVYSCDTAHWQWTYNKWVYSPSFQAFRQVLFTTPQLPDEAVIDANSLSVCAPPPAPAAPSSAGQSAHNASGGTQLLDDSNNLTVGNQIGSTATTGNAVITADTTAGNAVSGNANVTATVINSVQSSSSLSGGSVAVFTATVNGDVQGDLVIDPNRLQPASDSSSLHGTDVTVNSRTSGTLDNNINLNAASGNATVADSTKAGNATTGDASAVANVINVLNSVVSAGQSFVGVININGNLHGNILVPPDFVDQLAATNAPHATMALSAADAASLGITNTVTGSATTGGAAATGNTLAGSATTGNAATTVTIFNLTGAQLVGSNCMLVFVNVAGRWVGVIMNAPAGSTAVALGGHISKYAADSAAVDATANNAINNNIKLAAASGDAAVTDNTSAGNATSGNAGTAVNLLNLNNTQLNLSGWFGVLFINVFGSWFGNFGVYVPPSSHPAASSQGPQPAEHSAASSVHQVFQFVEQAHTADLRAATAGTGSGGDASLALLGAQLAGKTGRTLGASAQAVGRGLKPAPAAVHRSGNQLQLAGGLMTVIGLATLTVERTLSMRGARRLDA